MENFPNFLDKVQGLLPPERVLLDELTLSVYSRDASLYRIKPKVVIKVETEVEMVEVIQMASETQVAIGFRAAGTSLSGQALCEGALLIQGSGWRNHKVIDEGRSIRCEPGLTGSQVNAILKPYGRKLGPDPASIDAAKIGGIVANNASGMCCGTANNSYRTMMELKWITASGTLLDTSSPSSRENFREKEAELVEGIQSMAEEIRSQPNMVDLIREKYLIKNTTGYAINAFLDYQDPMDIISRLLIGSEGTLGFVSEITYKTVEDFVYKSNALMFFDSMEQACLAVQNLKHPSIKAIELMDYLALLSVESQLPAYYEGEKECTALLVDLQSNDLDELKRATKETKGVLKNYGAKGDFTFDPVAYASYWKIRKGMFPSVAAMRSQGETVIIEDVAFPMKDLAKATIAVQDLFKHYGYHNAIIFGHARDGNLHIVFNQSFQDAAEIERYDTLMGALAKLVTETYQGSLKAEHGTGRNMAPFVEMEWGPKIHQLMKRIKKLFDPKNILNPDVLITEDQELHLKNLKPMPQVHGEVDACMECGFCERVCPSKDLSLTPRQRIGALREMAQSSNPQALKQAFDYAGNETCAGDGMCGTVCPVKIDTGKMVKNLRSTSHSQGLQSWVKKLSHYQAVIEGVSRLGVRVHRWIKGLELSLPKELPGSLPEAAQPFKAPRSNRLDKKVVYYKSCIHRVFGAPEHTRESVDMSIESLAMKAGYEVLIYNKPGSCCGLPYASKGFDQAADLKRKETLEALEKLSEGGQYTVIVDNSPCSQQLILPENLGMKVVDSIQWLVKEVLPHLEVTKRSEPLQVFPTCSVSKLGLQNDLMTLAKALSEDVKVDAHIACCGFAGDKGFQTPELNRSALSRMSCGTSGCHEGVSSSRTCEIGLSWHSGVKFQHIAQKLDEQSQPYDENKI